MSFGRVAELYVYPLKGARAVRVTSAVITPRGFAGDRRYMLVDERGTFLSQRSHPALALVDAQLEQGGLRLRAGADELFVPTPSLGPTRRVRIWNDGCDVASAGPEAAKFFHRVLGTRCELVYMPDECERPVDPRYRATDGDIVSFADGFPFLIATTASLEAVAARVGSSLSMLRFRPNIVVSGTTAFEEDDWTELAIGDARFAVVKPCARCTVITVDPDTAEVQKEPLATLATFRKVGTKVMFGQNAIAMTSGIVHEGDNVRSAITSPEHTELR